MRPRTVNLVHFVVYEYGPNSVADILRLRLHVDASHARELGCPPSGPLRGSTCPRSRSETHLNGCPPGGFSKSFQDEKNWPTNKRRTTVSAHLSPQCGERMIFQRQGTSTDRINATLGGVDVHQSPSQRASSLSHNCHSAHSSMPNICLPSDPFPIFSMEVAAAALAKFIDVATDEA